MTNSADPDQLASSVAYLYYWQMVYVSGISKIGLRMKTLKSLSIAKRNTQKRPHSWNAALPNEHFLFKVKEKKQQHKNVFLVIHVTSDSSVRQL